MGVRLKEWDLPPGDWERKVKMALNVTPGGPVQGSQPD